MARYIVVRVEDNDTADRLLERLEAVPAIQPIGMFKTPTKFCPGKETCSQDRQVIRSRKTGILHCSVCKLPVDTFMHSPMNMLLEEGLPEKFVDFRISVREPYAPPREKYGDVAIETKKADIEVARTKTQRSRNRRTRSQRRIRSGR
jgi:hypothetical protein